MDVDELETGKKVPKKRNLEVLSVRELEEYIMELEIEIIRARDAIKTKESVRLGAESLFRK